MHSSFIRYTFASGKHFSFIAGLCTVLCFMLWGGVAQAQTMRTDLLSDINGNLHIPTSAGAADYTEAANLTDEVTIDNSVITTLVDWVEVQIRVIDKTETQPPTGLPGAPVAEASYTKAAWLLSDGSVVDADSTVVAACALSAADCTVTIPTDDAGLTFNESLQDLYIVINHRNHLAIMSSVAVPADDLDSTTDDPDIYEYDFSTADNTAQGTPLTLLSRGEFLGNGIYGVLAGKIDRRDNAINFLNDGPPIVTDNNAGGYQLSDLNMNGTVNFLDENPFIINNDNLESPIQY